jgi:hypothetical protein
MQSTMSQACESAFLQLMRAAELDSQLCCSFEEIFATRRCPIACWRGFSEECSPSQSLSSTAPLLSLLNIYDLISLIYDKFIYPPALPPSSRCILLTESRNQPGAQPPNPLHHALELLDNFLNWVQEQVAAQYDCRSFLELHNGDDVCVVNGNDGGENDRQVSMCSSAAAAAAVALADSIMQQSSRFSQNCHAHRAHSVKSIQNNKCNTSQDYRSVLLSDIITRARKFYAGGFFLCFLTKIFPSFTLDAAFSFKLLSAAAFCHDRCRLVCTNIREAITSRFCCSVADSFRIEAAHAPWNEPFLSVHV